MTMMMRIPTAGSYQAVTPFGGNYQAHLLNDVLPKQWCCDQSNLCNLYYTLRPRSRCWPSSFIAAFQWGDPHMLTLDGKSFTFNNLGEFTLINVKGTTQQNVSVDIKAQARTCRALNINGTETDATVWCAFALRTTQGGSVQVSTEKDQDGTGTFMLIFANTREYTVAFRDNAVFEEQSSDIFLSRQDNGALQISTQEGINFVVSVVDEVMELKVDIQNTLANLTEGLMGNFNLDSTDDFMYPNRSILDTNARDREIYEYVKTWAITEDTTIFTYEQGKGTADFSNASFVPIFLDEVDNATIAAAEAVCGGSTDTACVFDYVATQNAALAQRTQQALQEFDQDNQNDGSSAPEVTGPDSVNVTVGTNVTVTYNVTHADNQTYTVAVEDSSNQVVVTENPDGTVELEYVPVADVTQITSPTLVVVDQANLTTLTTVAVIQCSGCNNNGECDFANPRQVISPYISVASCVCQSPYTGLDCEKDRNGCEALPCPLLTKCTDVPADEELITNIAFTCTECPTGYRNDTGGQCADVNECQEGNPCGDVATCQNTIGSFICNCNSGYRKDNNGVCKDVDECAEVRNNCEQVCVNTPGDYKCECLNGFTLDAMGFDCIKDLVDPCNATNATCEYACDIVNGSAQCLCKQGFELGPDGRTCQDVDECGFNLCAQNCTNTIGSYVCSCYSGYKKDANDQQECIICEENKYGESCANTCECKGRSTGCDNVKGCLCVDGWVGTSCDTDVNECELRANLCPQEQMCVNTNGSYTCDCPTGYTVNGTACDDIDECADPLVSKCPQECTNSPGSFYCYCRNGFTYNITTNTCDDIDECATGVSGCEHDCINVAGSYNCQCKLGYVLNDDRKMCRKDASNPCAVSAKANNCSFGCTLVNGTDECFCERGYQLDTNGLDCKDVDECTTGHLCTDTCNNTMGSYECLCPVGKKLENDRRTCVACDPYHWGDNCANQCDCNPLGTAKCDPVSGCKCKDGWNGTTCYEDVLECPTDPCPVNSNCTETPGSYICTCDIGFYLEELSPGNKTCRDIDECKTNNVCDQACVNSIGSFTCTCDSGFLLEQRTECVDINECASNTTNPCEQTCRNLAGGFQCTCLDGYTLNLDNRQDCLDINECANTEDHTCSEFELCSNTRGSFNCNCKEGYDSSNDTCTRKYLWK
ncbi:latent-transforming growth factor beta-binding protein 4 [Elysia marginata]|uniref:Latent-transforming growth factor beta-binding protein 4 n=1 Tax=Elysia marginata TaxID=1093978 RepID=A0AAV4FTF7_9GAST|nr:latent-transforming growth factor beta-binding protein 4 [Elysia marginata]